MIETPLELDDSIPEPRHPANIILGNKTKNEEEKKLLTDEYIPSTHIGALNTLVGSLQDRLEESDLSVISNTALSLLSIVTSLGIAIAQKDNLYELFTTPSEISENDAYKLGTTFLAFACSLVIVLISIKSTQYYKHISKKTKNEIEKLEEKISELSEKTN